MSDGVLFYIRNSKWPSMVRGKQTQIYLGQNIEAATN